MRKQLSLDHRLGLILGSGLGNLADAVEDSISIPYDDIPHCPVSTVAGHSGRLIAGRWAGKPLLVFAGRFHYYEGYSMSQVTFPIRLMAGLGIKTVMVTNAAGGLRPDWRAGDLMLIRDHINLMGDNPLRGPNLERFGPRFPDLTGAYDSVLRRMAVETAQEQGITLHEGVYAGVTGPSYDTPAEARFLRIIGADAVGMSTVPEVIVARHCGLRVLAVSCLTNILTDGAKDSLDHRDVVTQAAAASENLTRVLRGVLEGL